MFNQFTDDMICSLVYICLYTVSESCHACLHYVLSFERYMCRLKTASDCSLTFDTYMWMWLYYCIIRFFAANYSIGESQLFSQKTVVTVVRELHRSQYWQRNYIMLRDYVNEHSDEWANQNIANKSINLSQVINLRF